MHTYSYKIKTEHALIRHVFPPVFLWPSSNLDYQSSHEQPWLSVGHHLCWEQISVWVEGFPQTFGKSLLLYEALFSSFGLPVTSIQQECICALTWRKRSGNTASCTFEHVAQEPHCRGCVKCEHSEMRRKRWYRVEQGAGILNRMHTQ